VRYYAQGLSMILITPSTLFWNTSYAVGASASGSQ
jgi:hypothetical protein